MNIIFNLKKYNGGQTTHMQIEKDVNHSRIHTKKILFFFQFIT